MPVEDDAGAAVARRRLGRLLIQLREKARDSDGKAITIEQAAEYMERARPTLWRIEHGLPGVRIKNHDVKSLCELYGADDQTRDDLLALAAATRVKGWFHPYSDVLSPGFDMYIGLETAASSICAYEADRVHGLMQTAEYAREIIRIPGPDGHARTEEDVERRVQVRLRRQDILTRTDPQPAQLELIFGEAVLHRAVGGPEVMAGQLRHIAELGELPNVTVRVIPFEAGIHQGVISGPFAILRFPDDSEPATGYMDSFIGNLLFDRPQEVGRLETAFADIQANALDDQASRRLVERAAKEFSRA